MIRPTHEAETEDLVAMAEGTGVFKPIEIEALRDLLTYHRDEGHAVGHQAVTLERDGVPVGFAYFAPTVMTDSTWHLYWIFVSKTVQARGLGAELLKFVETEIRSADGRMLLIETSSLPMYEQTRKFYLKQQYEQEAMIRDFYSAGDHQVIFRKLL
jgi:GNAT superfamily N-acetyltransferase